MNWKKLNTVQESMRKRFGKVNKINQKYLVKLSKESESLNPQSKDSKGRHYNRFNNIQETINIYFKSLYFIKLEN